jgi:16S rRNA (uracil1498-N3)-methyltransferase
VLSVGVMQLDAAESHHARAVMRLGIGETIELFDSTGQTASGPIVQIEPTVAVQINAIASPPPAGAEIIIASAVPKGNRADWMIEKLAEIGVTRFIPLQTDRSVVHPEGAGKLDRWQRLASEAAKQSRRTGTLEISPLTTLPMLVRELQSQAAARWFLTTRPPAEAFAEAVQALQPGRPVYLVIGPEGGWTDQEEDAFRAAKFAAVALTPSILRIETAALVAAGAVASWLNGR